jgi:hypothetical protein
MQHLTPAQRLGMTANLVIFLGIMSTVFHLLGFLGVLHGYRLPGLVVALALCGCGYGIRYGSGVCLYAAAGICAGLSIQYSVQASTTWAVSSLLRFGLSAWACWRLCQALPTLQQLQHAGAFPLPMSRYGALVWRRVRSR